MDRIESRKHAFALALETTFHWEDLMGPPDRRRPELNALQRRLWAALSDLGWSSARIGLVVGRDHTTVLRGIKKARAR